MRYLLEQGYRVIPVRPHRTEILGVPVASSLREIDEPIDLVDVFRRTEFCPAVAEEAAAVGAKGLWLQLGLVSPEARAIAERAGMEYVENECTAIVHASSRANHQRHYADEVLGERERQQQPQHRPLS